MKLSEFKYKKLLFKYDKNVIDKIVYTNNKYNNTLCDVAIVFGNERLYKYRLDSAIELYNKKLIKKIAICGGIGYFNMNRNVTEASKMKLYLINNGISKKDIIVEDKSRNTIESIINIKKILSDKYKKILLISSSFHIKRCYYLFLNIFQKEKNVYYIGCNDFKTDKDCWNKSLIGKRYILAEAISLVNFARKGKIKDIDIK